MNVIGRAKLSRAYHFVGRRPLSEQPATIRKPAERYRNTIVLGKEWQRALGEQAALSWAQLARKLGVSRARVTQVLGLLNIAPEVMEAIAALRDPLPRPFVSVRMLRPFLELSHAEQLRALEDLTFRLQSDAAENACPSGKGTGRDMGRTGNHGRVIR